MEGFWADVFYISNYFPDRISGGWSLSSEEQFYIFFPALLVLGVRLIPARILVLIPAVWFLLLPIFRAQSQLDKNIAYYAFHTHSDGLAAGTLLSWVAVFRPQWMQPGPLLRNLIIPVLFAVLGIMLDLLNPAVFKFSSLALIFGGAALFLIQDSQPGQSRSIAYWGWLNWQGFYVLSRLSYGIYLNHFGLTRGFGDLLSQWLGSSPLGLIFSYLALLAMCMTTSFISFAWIELPFLRLRHRLLEGNLSQAHS